MDLIERQAAIDVLAEMQGRCTSKAALIQNSKIWQQIKDLPSAEPERLTDDDFETIRIHLNAYKEKLCNQRRWKEAGEYQRIIDRFMEFASAQPEQHWIPCSERLPEERGFYLTTTKDKAVYCDYWNEDNFDRTEMVIAWMPLPEPYKEDDHEID